MALGAVPDLHHQSGFRYSPPPTYKAVGVQSTNSEWFLVKRGSPDTTLTLSLPETPGAAPFTLVLSVGVVMGSVSAYGPIEPVAHFGAAKILCGL